MRTDDWVNVGLRLYGTYLLVQVALGTVGWVYLVSDSDSFHFEAGHPAALQALRLGVMALLGLFLIGRGKRAVRGASTPVPTDPRPGEGG